MAGLGAIVFSELHLFQRVVFAIGAALFVAAIIAHNIGEAFNSTILKTPENFEAERQLRLWAIYLVVALSVTVSLFVTYRQNYRRK